MAIQGEVQGGLVKLHLAAKDVIHSLATHLKCPIICKRSTRLAAAENHSHPNQFVSVAVQRICY